MGAGALFVGPLRFELRVAEGDRAGKRPGRSGRCVGMGELRGVVLFSAHQGWASDTSGEAGRETSVDR